MEGSLLLGDLGFLGEVFRFPYETVTLKLGIFLGDFTFIKSGLSSELSELDLLNCSVRILKVCILTGCRCFASYFSLYFLYLEYAVRRYVLVDTGLLSLHSSSLDPSVSSNEPSRIRSSRSIL